MFAFLQCLVPCVVKYVVKSVGNLAGVPVGDWCVEVWESYRTRWSAEEMRRELEQIAQDPKCFRDQVGPALRDLAPGQPPEVLEAAAAYLRQVPDRIHRSLQRPDDPTGRTLPPGLPLRRAEHLRPFLPESFPRFKKGDHPLPGNDLVVEELLGVGGFGEVWRARHARRPDAPPVALKFCTDEAAARSLKNELQLLDRVASRGRHPGIVELKYAHLEGDPPCLEYEYVEGGDLGGLLADLHRTQRATPAAVARIVLRVALAVGFAHRQRPPIVHRDLKPANILTRRDAGGRLEIKVADFGIGGIAAGQAIAEWSREGIASRGSSLAEGTCTPLYASPQQRRDGPPDPRDDVYALGVIWFQLLTGDVTKEPPRGGGWKKRFAEQGMDAALIDLLEQCLEDDPADRPEDAQALADRLTAAFEAGETPPEVVPVAGPPVVVPVTSPPALPPVQAASVASPGFAAWYGSKFGHLAIGWHVLLWLFYGFLWIPVYYFFSSRAASAEALQARLTALQGAQALRQQLQITDGSDFMEQALQHFAQTMVNGGELQFEPLSYIADEVRRRHRRGGQVDHAAAAIRFAGTPQKLVRYWRQKYPTHPRVTLEGGEAGFAALNRRKYPDDPD